MTGGSPLCALQRVHGPPRLVAALSAVPTCKGCGDKGRNQIDGVQLWRGGGGEKLLYGCTCVTAGSPSEGREHSTSGASQLTRDCVRQAITTLEAFGPKVKRLS